MGNRFIKNIRYLWECVLEVLYASSDGCLLCDEVTEDEEVCQRCLSKIKFCDSSYTLHHEQRELEYYSVAYYAGPMMELILRLKYKSDFQAGEILARFMTEVVQKRKLTYDLISFVPSSNTALKRRGYNQSQYLARCISRETEIKAAALLYQVRETKDQIGLSGKERWNNCAGSFQVKNEEKVKGKHILLVDDVITTGATAFYCSEALLKAGAGKVIILTAAKSKV